MFNINLEFRCKIWSNGTLEENDDTETKIDNFETLPDNIGQH